MPVTGFAPPTLLTDPGFLLWAPLASSVPTNTVAGSVFTDSWSSPWVVLGATDNGTTFNYATTVEARSVAEYLDPIQWATTARNGNIAFNLTNFTLANLKKAMNGGALTVASGTGATQLNTYTPPAPGAEVRCMIGWESFDQTMRIVAYQTLNAATIAAAFQKAPAYATIPCQFNFEVPSTGTPFQVWTAGTSRA